MVALMGRMKRGYKLIGLERTRVLIGETEIQEDLRGDKALEPCQQRNMLI